MKKKALWIVALLLVILAGFGIGFSLYWNKKEIPIDKTATENDTVMSDFQRESKEKEEEYRNKTIAEKKQTLIDDQGLFAMDSIVLQNTTKEDAERIAEEIGAEVRTTKAGDYAVLYLPEGVTIEDVYDNEQYAVDVTKMSPDYYVGSNELTDYDVSTFCNGVNKNTNINVFNNKENGEDDPEGENEEDMPSIIERTVLKARPEYSVNDTGYGNQQYLDYINLRDTWNTTKGNGITVAVIDSGIDTDHPEFAGKISDKSYNASEDKIVKDYDMSVIEDENGHGTAVSGVLCAAMNNEEGIVGVAPDINLLVIKCDIDESGEFVRGSDIVFGLAYAIETDVDIINMSFRSYEDIFSRYTELAVDSDIICIASAGNDGSNIPVYPASLDSVIAVGAYDTETGEPTSYSNYGENVDILAPGTAYTTALDGGYKIANGTSVSSPIAAGAAALYLAQNGKTEFDVMRQMFEASSIDLGILGEDYHNGFGEIDIHALVCEEKGTISYDMMTDELENEQQYFVKGHTIQTMPEPERLYLVYDGWFFDPNCTDECELYTNIFSEDITLYANWINEDDGTVFAYTTKSDNTIEIRAYTGKRRYITVPNVIEGKNVTSIGENAFADNSRLRSVILPQSITSINERAFVNCSMLREIEIPDNAMSIGNEAFSGCSRLGNVAISNSSKLESVGYQAFAFCGINEFSIPATLTSLGRRVFYGSTALRSVTVASGNPNYLIKNSALYDISGTNLIYYPAALAGEYTVDVATTQISEVAFAYSRSINVVLNDGLLNVEDEGFAYSKIKSISIPASVIKLGKSVCANCKSLNNLIFADNGNLSAISECAFYSDQNLGSICIPDYIIKIDSSAFLCCGLVTVDFAENSTLVNIGMSAFSCNPIKTISIPDSVEVISGCAFSNNYSLNNVSFGKNSNCTTILANAFSYDYELKSFVIPDKVTLLGDTAFYNSGIESIEIGAGLVEVGKGVFASCKKLSEIRVSADNPKYASYEGVLYSKDRSVLMLYPAAKSGTYETATETVKIDNYAFSGADKLTDIVLNEGLIQIGENAFEYCEKLNTPILPSTLEEIDGYAFRWCSSMEGRLTLPKKLKSISWYAFYYDYNLKEIDFEPESEMDRLGYGAFAYCGIEDFTIPRNVSTISQEVFTGCKDLLAVTFESESKIENIPAWLFSGADNLRRITFEDECELKQFEARACEGLLYLESIDFSGCDKLTNIDNYAFRNCISLENLTLPDSMKEIGRYAFYGCNKMNEMRLPEGLSSIGRYAFTNTDNINLYFLAPVLPVNLEDKWDYGIGGYYVGINNVIENDEWVYALTADGKASVIRYKGNASNIDLDTIDGHEVVSIGSETFKDNNTLTSISLPETLTGIYKAAFSGTSSLGSIMIPKSVRVIDSEAFKDSGISELTFASESELVTIGSSAFENTGNLNSISIPDGITDIRENTFYKSSVKNATLSANVSTIDRLAFSESGLESINIPASIKEISYKAFKNAKSLQNVSFAVSDTEMMIRDEAFYGSGLTTVSIPANVTYIGNLCFSRCQSLTEINVDNANAIYASLDGVFYNKALNKLITCPAGKTGSYTVSDNVALFAVGAFEGSLLSEIVIPDACSLQTIGHRTFFECDNLTSINIPDSVQSIEYYAFGYCDNLETVTINQTSNLGGIYEGAFYNCAKLGSVIIPDGVTEISDYAFYGCSALAEVSFGENSQLQGIYDHAFEYAGIENFVMPKNMIEIGAYAFHGTKLKTIKFNTVLKDIGDYAFSNSGMDEVKELIIPDSTERIGKGVLEGITSIEVLSIPFLGSSKNNLFINSGSSHEASIEYLYGKLPDFAARDLLKNLHRIAVRGGERVGEWAFEAVPVEDLYLADSIYEFGNNAIEGADKLKYIRMSQNMEYISCGMFSGCKSLISIDIPKSCIYIRNNAFEFCESLQEIKIPVNITVIEDNAFLGCCNITDINVDDNNKSFIVENNILYDINKTRLIKASNSLSGNVVIRDGVKKIEGSAFDGNGSISEISMPDSLEIIGPYAFRNCHSLSVIRKWSDHLTEISPSSFEKTSLEEVEIPDSVSIIGGQAFYGCEALKIVKLGDGVEYIGIQAFAYNTRLVDIDFGSSIKDIYDYGFSYCTSLESVFIPDSVELISRGAFSHCTSLSIAYISKNIKNIEDGAFSYCDKLKTIIVDSSNYCFYNNMLFDGSMTKLLFVPNSVSGKVEIPEGVKVIETGTFADHDSITEIVLPDSLEEIKDSAFYSCDKLVSITFGCNIKKIGGNVFFNTPFYENNLIRFNGVGYIGKFAVSKYFQAIECKSLVIKDGTEVISSNLFNSCQFEELYLPDSLKYIDEYAFAWCDKLKHVRWGKNIEYIGEGAFRSDPIVSIELFNKKVISEGSLTSAQFVNANIDINEINIPNYHLNLSTYGTYVGLYNAQVGYYPKNIVFEDEKQLVNSDIIGIENSNIYTKTEKNFGSFDERTINNNNIYYNNEWHMAKFYVNEMLIHMAAVKNNEMLQNPAENLIYEYIDNNSDFVGWDTDDDGVADEIPAILTSDIVAKAIFDAPIKRIELDYDNYSIKCDENGDVVYDEDGNGVFECKWINIDRYKTRTIGYIIEPYNYTQNDKVIWTSSDDNCLTVDETGKIKALRVPDEGYVTVRAMLAENTDIFDEVRVYINSVTDGIILNDSMVDINKGNTYSIEPQLLVPDGYTTDINYSSNDNTIASVDENGIINAVEVGNTEINITCGADYSATLYVSVKQPITGIRISETEGTVNVGETLELSPIFEPANTTDDKSVFWYSKDTSIAKVNSSGVITGVAPGTVEIVGVVGNFKVTYIATVKAPIERITLNTSRGTLRLDHTKQLDVIYIPSNTTDDKSITWSSADSDIATVDENGLVTGITTGKTTITGQVGEHTATYEVSVIGLRDPDTGITVTNSDDTEMEEGTELDVDGLEPTELTGEMSKGWLLYREILYGWFHPGFIRHAYIYDISMLFEGKTVQPGTTVDVELPIPRYMSHDRIIVYRIEEDGTITNMHGYIKDGKYCFTTDHFSVYAFGTETEESYIETIEPEQNELNMTLDESGKISFATVPEEPDNNDITFESSDESVITVDEEGNVTPVSIGTADITIKAVDSEAEAVVKVSVGHKYGKLIEEVPATCTVDGMKAHYECSVCHKLFIKDGNDYVEKTEAELTIKATGHTYDQEVVDEKYLKSKADCTNSAVYYKSCHCGAKGNETFENGEPLGHDWDEGVITKEPTSKEDGIKTFTCKRCKVTKTEPVKYDGGDDPKVIHVTGVTLNKSSVNIMKGDMLILKVTVTPKDATDKTVKWTSSNGKVASVDNNGTVKALSKGSAVITVTTVDGSKTAKCEVTVIDDNSEPDDPKPDDPKPDDPIAESVTMYRLYNPNSGEHFYTASQSEIDTIVAAGWKNEGVAWKAPKKSKTPVYRLYNPNAGDHHYTTNEAEKDNLISVGWNDEGIGWYSDDNKGIVLYRLYNPNAQTGSHHYTTSEAEKDNLVTVGWKYEGAAWYGMK